MVRQSSSLIVRWTERSIPVVSLVYSDEFLVNVLVTGSRVAEGDPMCSPTPGSQRRTPLIRTTLTPIETLTVSQNQYFQPYSINEDERQQAVIKIWQYKPNTIRTVVL